MLLKVDFLYKNDYNYEDVHVATYINTAKLICCCYVSCSHTLTTWMEFSFLIPTAIISVYIFLHAYCQEVILHQFIWHTCMCACVCAWVCVILYRFFNFHIIFHMFIMLNCKMCMFEFVEGLMEDWRKQKESPSLNKVYLLTNLLTYYLLTYLLT